MTADLLRESPEVATALGLSTEQAGGPHLGRLSDASADGAARGRAMMESALATLGTIDRDALPAAEQVTYDVVSVAFTNQLATEQFEFGDGATQPYVVNQLTGAYTSIPDFLNARHPLTNAEHLDGYLARLSAYARMLDQETDRINADAGRGIVPPDFAIDGAVRQLRGFASLDAAQTILVQSLQRRLPEISGVGEEAKAEAVQQATAIVREAVLPAYNRQIQALMGLRISAGSDPGMWRLPRGEEAYAAALRLHTTTDMSADEVHQMGLDLSAQLTSEMDALLRAEGLTDGSLAERIATLSRRPDQLYPNTDAGRADLLGDLNEIVAEMTARMPEVFDLQARTPLEIRRIPPYTEAGSAGGYYWSGAIDGSRPGAYYINLRDMREIPKFGLPTLTYHEGVPGHHWQVSISQEASALPLIRSSLLSFNSYIEGWALYAEYLADEIGAYAANALGRLGFLQAAAFRAARLVVDTGMHDRRWSRERAIRTMIDATGEEASAVSSEVERYAVAPAQACSYMVGRQAILGMRDRAITRLGAEFDLRGFHNVVLSNGSTPLSVLERLVAEWRPASAG